MILEVNPASPHIHALSSAQHNRSNFRSAAAPMSGAVLDVVLGLARGNGPTLPEGVKRLTAIVQQRRPSPEALAIGAAVVGGGALLLVLRRRARQAAAARIAEREAVVPAFHKLLSQRHSRARLDGERQLPSRCATPATVRTAPDVYIATSVFLCLAVRARRESAIQVVLTGGPMGGKATLAAKLASVLTEKVHARVEAPRSIRPHGAACPPPPPQSHALRLRHDASPSRAFAATGGVARAAAHRGLRSSSPPRHPLSSSTAAAHFQQRATRKACYFSRARCAGEWHARRFPRGPAHSPHDPLCSRAHRCSAFSIALRLRSSTLRRRRVSDA